MLHYDVIAVGTDGSDGAQKAVRTAASMARAYQAKLIIVTAFYTHHGGVFGAHSRETDKLPIVSEESAESYLDAAVKIAAEEGADKVEVIPKSGDPVHALMEVGEEHDVDVFVVGNRGINSLSGRVFGSVSTELMRKVHCDVVVVNTTQQ